MLVLIYKENNQRLVFPAIYGEEEMDGKLLVSKTDELVRAGILKTGKERFLLTEPYASFVEGITQAEIFVNADTVHGGISPLFSYLRADYVICFEAAQTRPGQFRICRADYSEWFNIVSAHFGIESESCIDADSGFFEQEQIFDGEYTVGCLEIANNVGGEKIMTVDVPDIFPYPMMQCSSESGVCVKSFGKKELLEVISECWKGGNLCDIG